MSEGSEAPPNKGDTEMDDHHDAAEPVGAGAQSPEQPLLRIVTPDATPEEVAAIVAVLAALGGDDTPPAPRRAEWNTPARMVRPSVTAGPGGWRASALPH